MKYLVIAFIAAGFFVACTPKTSEIVEVAETTQESNEETTSTDGEMPKADIGEGKVIFLRDCITCHGYTTGPKSVADLSNFSKAQIDAVLPKMTENAKLNPTQIRQVTAYLHWKKEN